MHIYFFFFFFEREREKGKRPSFPEMRCTAVGREGLNHRLPEIDVSEQGQKQTTNSTQIRHRVQELNPGHTGGRRVLKVIVCYNRAQSVGQGYFKVQEQ